MNSLKNNSKFKRGGISMFLVVIVGSLVALMVASFMRLVVRDQSQASNLDLSQSAYDSAQVGVEDAKKFMDLYSSNCANGFDVSTPECVQMRDSLNSTQWLMQFHKER
jgi:Tfp pilus assembly protein PilX